MNPAYTSILLAFYGFFLIICGIVSVALIGMKAKTALLSGGMAGIIAITINYLNHYHPSLSTLIAWLVFPLMLFIVFGWRSAKTLFKIFELLQSSKKDELQGKGIAFLIISLMAIVSIVIFIVHLNLFTSNLG